MNPETTKSKKMSVSDFFDALAANEEFVFAVAHTNSFKKDVKLCYKQNLDLEELYNVIVKLAKREKLPDRNREHNLKGKKKKTDEEIKECHVLNDWILVWVEKEEEMILIFTDTGTHAYVLGM
ncbi:MAG: type II toxin-antitoxin system YafQ family toxin [Candidatus Symbiothrix sp.]|jgi:mRNA interferase YafQ|nr:type II toxin-antitoxin system YafQ family toxin [Candidatus Symbiothrix sp.]